MQCWWIFDEFEYVSNGLAEVVFCSCFWEGCQMREECEGINVSYTGGGWD
jgi:hypothetical protein